jgi:hypothetical protein
VIDNPTKVGNGYSMEWQLLALVVKLESTSLALIIIRT